MAKLATLIEGNFQSLFWEQLREKVLIDGEEGDLGLVDRNLINNSKRKRDISLTNSNNVIS